ncbi:hypothetical protein BHYA_0002g01320 [Botrytis hyacinthi]|uniref:Uncharacterized protein n=1 Tax=Botrytis hyacinthi TaxID=278943 RepID=A0A4Z1HE68_9HELO|nr:hypothetical protein BHYA_0002g01320 [Botrytis hyacinthi]
MNNSAQQKEWQRFATRPPMNIDFKPGVLDNRSEEDSGSACSLLSLLSHVSKQTTLRSYRGWLRVVRFGRLIQEQSGGRGLNFDGFIVQFHN